MVSPPASPAAGDLHPGRILGALASETRLRVFAAAVLTDGSVAEVASAAGVSVRAAERALDRLAAAGLLSAAGPPAGAGPDAGQQAGPVVAGAEVFAVAARRAARMHVPADPVDMGATEQQAAVLRGFWDDGRLRSIPTQQAKRRVVLDFVAQQFEPGTVYPEPHVNRIIGTLHPDYAALRRHLVDDGFLERRHGFYWRAGGSFDVD